MKILIAEYTTTITQNSYLSREGMAMVSTLRDSFERLGHTVVVLPNNSDFNTELERLAPQCDCGIVIAPDDILSKYTHTLETSTHNLGSDSTCIAVCANKRLTSKILSSIGINVPKEVGTDYNGKRVIKPIKGCGSIGVRIAKPNETPTKDEMMVEFVEGTHYSVSLVGSRVVGDACEYYSGLPPVILTINTQNYKIDENGCITYHGGETPIHPVNELEIIRVAKQTAERLGCQGYVGIDMVVSDKIWVIDVNPRPTLSIVGISKVLVDEIADILIKSSFGNPPEHVNFNGKTIKFNENGEDISLI
ncbi:MAG TPA: ATP-grasp domain-containing protein [Methanocorpusculum sp.]|nr:ATP-grasp domain-containing protein [Methanocorpusculum sp.]